MLEAPDRGYAWVIVLSAGIINTLLSGISRMVGMLYVAILQEYPVDRNQASLPFISRNTVRFLAGPLVGVLGQRFGIRSVTFFGGLVAALGSILCSFAPSVTWIVVFWGGIHGLGFALGNTLFQVLVNQYFDRHRATASGLVLSGACICSFLYPFLIGAFLDDFGLSGCFLLLGGLFLNVLPFSLLLKEPLWVRDPTGYAKKKAFYESRRASSSAPFDAPEVSGSRSTLGRWCCGGADDFDLHERRCSRSVHPVCTLYTMMAGDALPKKPQVLSISQTIPVAPESKDVSQKKAPPCGGLPHTTLLTEARSILTLYLEPAYLLISVSVATYFFLFLPFMTVVVDYTRDKGIDRVYEKYLIHALTLGDLSGRLLLGWVTDRRFVSLPVFVGGAFVAQGGCAALVPLSSSAWPYAAAAALYGVCAGTLFAHFPVLVHRYVDQRRQQVAIGCIGVLSALLTTGIPSLIGYFRDQVGSYDGLFYTLGAASGINGAIWLCVGAQKGQRSSGKSPT